MTSGLLRRLAGALARRRQCLSRSGLRWLALGALASASSLAGAQTAAWPTKPVRIVTPFAAGGTVEVVARLLADALSRNTGQSFLVDSKPGASGSIGSVEVARAPADGYTLLFSTNSTHSIAPAIFGKRHYDSVEDFTPLALIGEANVFLLASPTLNIKTLPELLALARAKPGTLNFGSGGAGTHGHLTWELLKAQAGVELTHVPYKGIGAAYPDLMSGAIHLLTDGIPGGTTQVKAGRAIALAVTGPRRSPVVPDVPTAGETLPGYAVLSWFGLWGPRGLPPALTTRINEEVNKALSAPDFAARVAGMGLETGSGSPAKFAEYVAADLKQWTQVVRERNIKVD